MDSAEDFIRLRTASAVELPPVIRFEQDSSSINYNQYGIGSFTFHVIDDDFYILSAPSLVIWLRGKEVDMCRSPRYRQVLPDPNAQILDPPGQSAFDVRHIPSSSSLLVRARSGAIHIPPPTSAPKSLTYVSLEPRLTFIWRPK